MIQGLIASAEEKSGKYSTEKDKDRVVEDDGVRDEAQDMHFRAGSSKRIWNELYKVGHFYTLIFCIVLKVPLLPLEMLHKFFIPVDILKKETKPPGTNALSVTTGIYIRVSENKERSGGGGDLNVC